MEYADFMAFPFPQHELITKQGKLEIAPDIQLDVCHTTSVPPYIHKMDDIVKEHLWFLNLLGKQSSTKRLSCFFGLQHPPEGATRSDLLTLKGLGIRFMTLAYEGKNEYGGGFAAPDEPLTEKGKELIEAMAKTGIALDLSHAGHRTAREAIDYIQKYKLGILVVATHTACFSLYNHGRNLPDDVLRGIRDLDGLIGLITISWMLHENDNSLQPFLNHLDYLVELVGIGCVCLGTDGVYLHLDPDEELRRFILMKNKIDPRGTFGARYPEQAVELNRPDRLTVIEGKLSSLKWPDSHIKSVIGGNLNRLFSRL